MGRSLWFAVACVPAIGCGRVGFESIDPSRCGSSTAMICDGFEHADLDADWMPHTFGGALEIDPNRARRGWSSLHSHTDATMTPIDHPRATAVTYQGFGSGVIGTIYVRLWAYFQSPLPGRYLDQVLNFSDDAGKGIALGAKGGVIVTNDYTSSLYAESATALPLDQWVCLVFVVPSGIAGATRVYLDGSELTDVVLAKSTRQPPPTHIFVGTQSQGMPDVDQPAADVWLDELLIDNVPLRCDD